MTADAKGRGPAPDRATGPLVIAQLCHGSLGGSSRVACRLANALARRGHEVQVFSRQTLPWALGEGIAQQALRPDSGDLEAPLYWDWSEAELTAFGELLAARLRRQRVDVLHYHYAQPFAGLVSRLAAALGAQMPLVIGTLHGTDLTRCLRDPVALTALGQSLSTTAALTTVSQHMRRLAEAIPGLPPGLPVLPNFVEDAWPGPGEGGPLPDRPALLHVSNFRAVKDLGLLARLFLAVHARSGAELWLVGDGPELPMLRALLQRSPAAGAVRYLGACAQPEVHFRAATLLLSTSLEESFGLAVLEAMASGTPVVATAVGGIPELVRDEVTGLLFAPENWPRTADRIVALLGTPARLQALRRACLAQAAPLREARVIGLYEGLYRQALRRAAMG